MLPADGTFEAWCIDVILIMAAFIAFGWNMGINLANMKKYADRRGWL